LFPRIRKDFKEKSSIPRCSAAGILYSIITHFGGDHALYVDEQIINKHYNIYHKPARTALAAFEQTLISHYGTSIKSLFDYPHDKYPKYYIDNFTDIKQQFKFIKSRA
jgi:hypothetical protein